jgi:transposase
MDVIYGRCCGLDLHKRTVVACLLTPGAKGKPTKTVRSFGTMTEDILAMADWLSQAGCTHVAMESTGVFWKPIYNLLEGAFELLLVNACHIKAVPGRKTDVQDCEWIADLLQHGLLTPSFVPDRPQRELRELTRYRMTLVRERTAVANRLQKILEGANIKLASVATDILGASGREILTALVSGETDASVLAAHAKGRLRAKHAELQRALAGRVGEHQRFMIHQQLAHVDFLERALGEVNAEIADRLRSEERAIVQLDSIPGIGRQWAEALIAELGTDMGRFASAHHLASWAGVCPGNYRSAGKQRSGKTRKANPWLRALLVQAAHAAARRKGSYLAAQYARLAARRGKSRAAVAVAHSILVIAYHLLERGTEYQDLGSNYFDERDRQATQRRLVRRLEHMGFKVSLESTTAA